MIRRLRFQMHVPPGCMHTQTVWTKVLLPLLFSTFFIQSTGAQERAKPRTTSFQSTFSELEGRDVFDMEVGKDDRIYFGGSMGVCSYNGSYLIYLDSLQQLSGAVVVLFKDFEQRVWALDFKNQLFRINEETGILEPYVYNDTLSQIARGKSFENAKFDSLGALHISFRNTSYWQITAEGQVIKMASRSNQAQNGMYITELIDGQAFYFSVLDKKRRDGYFLFDARDIHNPKPIEKLNIEYQYYESTLLNTPDDHMLIALGNDQLIKFNFDSIIFSKKYASPIIKLFRDDYDDLWVGTVNKGTHRHRKFDLNTSDHFLDNQASAAVTQDINGGIWLKSDKEKIVHIPYPQTQQLTEDQCLTNTKAILSASAGKGNSYILSEGGNVDIVSDAGMQHLRSPIYPANQLSSTSRSPHLIKFDSISNRLWLAHASHILRREDSTWTEIKVDSLGPIRHIYLLEDSILWGHTQTHLFYINPADEVVSHRISQNPKTIQDVTATKNHIWLSSDDGLWNWKDGHMQRPVFENQTSSILTDDIEIIEGAGQSLWLIKANGDLYHVNVSSEVITKCDAKKISQRESIYAVHEGVLWVASNWGELQRIEFNKDGFVFSSFGIDDKALTHTSGSLLIYKEKVISWTGSGLFETNLNNFKNHQGLPIPRFEFFQVHNEFKELKKHYELAHDENHIKIWFNGLCYREPNDDLIYRFKLEGLESQWQSTGHGQLQYPNLAPGNYSFKFQTAYNSQPWSETASIDITIHPPFWATWWFKTLIILCSIGLLILLFVLRARQIRRQEKVKLEMAQLELKALKAQINPHFVFNALSSVQYYLAKHKPLEAEAYVNRFSKLIRTVLDNSESNTVLLQREIELIELYVNLESDRFKGEKISLCLKVDEHIPMTAVVPPAIFQPYVENAIWHGLRTKEGLRELKITFTLETEVLAIAIEDNGIGREASQQNKFDTNNKKSFGIQIANRRLELLNKNSGLATHIEDLKDERNTAVGTRVILRIPLQKAQTA